MKFPSDLITGKTKTKAVNVVYLMAVAWLFLLSCTAQADIEMEAAQTFQINIEQGSVEQALKTLAQQTAVQVIFSYDLVASLEADSLEGNYRVTDALEILLKDTGLSGSLTRTGVITILFDDQNQNSKGKRDMNIKAKRSLLATAIGMFAAGGTGFAVAQEEGATTQGNIDEVIVTAQKREQRLIDVPISMSVMNENELQKRSIQNMRDLSFHVPNLTIQGSGNGEQNPIIRGVSNTTAGNSALVGIYLDEIALPTVSLQGFELQTDDIQHIEVLKGPQGTLFGQGAMGGVIRYVSNKPSFDGVEGLLRTSGSATEGGDSSQEFAAVVNIPVVDDVFALRLNATYKDIGGWIETINPDTQATITENSNDKQVSNLQLKGLWQPNEDLSVDILAIQYKNNAGNQNNASEGSTFPLIVRNGLPFYSTDVGNDYTIYGLTLIYDLGFATLTSASSSFDTVQDRSLTNRVAYAGGGSFTGVATGLSNEIEGVSQELRLNGTSTDMRLNWTAGMFFNQYEFLRSADVNTGYRNGDQIWQSLNYREMENSESIAYFIDTSYALTEQLTLDLGVRYFEDDREVGAGNTLGAGDSLDPATLKKATFDKISSKIALSYAPNDNSNIYLRIAEGFRSGGLNSGDGVIYDPESLIAYELGFKTAMGRLRAEGNLYYSIYDDYQGGVFDVSLPNGAAVINAGEAEITGFEWLLQWQFNDQWSFAFNGHVTESEYTSLHPGFFGAKEGDPLNAIEKYGYGVSVDYAFNWSSSVAGFAYMGYNRQGPSTTTIRDAGYARGDSVESDVTGYLDMRIGAEWDTFTVNFFGRNLTNEKRPNILVLATEFNDIQSRPRELGVELSYRF